MNLTKLTVAQFTKIAGLLEKKEALQARINDIDQKLTALGGDDAAAEAAASPSPAPAATSGRGKYRRSAAVRAKMAASQKARWARPDGAATAGVVAKPAGIPTAGRKAGKAGRSQRGAVKEAIIDLIKRAGKAGITVKEVAETLGVKYANASVWFGSTGKKVKEIKRVSRGTYAWVA